MNPKNEPFDLYHLLRCDNFSVIEKLWRDDGRCGEDYTINGKPGQCDPTKEENEKGPCCSSGGWCGSSHNHCNCTTCVDYRQKQGDIYVYLGSQKFIGRLFHRI